MKLTSMFLCNVYKDCTSVYKMWKISCSPFSLRICVHGHPVAIKFIQPIPGWNCPEPGATSFQCFFSVCSDKYDYS